MRNRVQRGKASAFPLVEEALKEVSTNPLGEGPTSPFVGSQDSIYERLNPFIKKADPEELKIVTICEPFDAKTKSYKLMKDLFD